VARGRLAAIRDVAVFLVRACALVGLAVVVPRMVDGYSALLWTRFHAERLGAPRPVEHARRAGRFAARTVELTAPFPWAAEAAQVALSAARAHEEANRTAAAALVAELRPALERVSASRVRGLGLAQVTAEARALDDSTRLLGGVPR
jgi:hypothetical protein